MNGDTLLARITPCLEILANSLMVLFANLLNILILISLSILPSIFNNEIDICINEINVSCPGIDKP